MDDTKQTQIPNTNPGGVPAQSVLSSNTGSTPSDQKTFDSSQGEHTLIQFPQKPQPTVPSTPSQPDLDTPDEDGLVPGYASPSFVEETAGKAEKEVEPLPSLTADVAEVVKPAEVAVDIEPEIEAAGVEEVSAIPQLTKEDTSAGLNLAKETIPVQPVPPAAPQNTHPSTVMSKQKIQSLIGKLPIFIHSSESSVWLAYLVQKYNEMQGDKS